MTLAALALLVIAAFLHAGWNLLAKQAGGGVVFVWLFATVSAVLYAPLAVTWAVLDPPTMGRSAWLCVVATAFLHVGYFLALQRGYRWGDLSVVYPLARGTGPMLAALAAIVFFGERPSTLALIGIGLIIVGVFTISGGVRGLTSAMTPRIAIGYGLLTGVLIASYTLLDKFAVATLMVTPLVYDWLSNMGRAVIMTPLAWRRRDEIRGQWIAHRGAILGVAVMSPLAYILVLTAMTFTPLSYIAPAREMSILVGVVLGARFLAEGELVARLAGAAAIVAGVVALMLG